MNDPASFGPAPSGEGIVTARPCSCCGHHEIGIVTPGGAYIPLRPGMRVRIVGAAEPPVTDPPA